MVELLFGRLDGRTASFAATRDLVERYFPGEYRVIHPGSRPAAAARGAVGSRPRSSSRPRRSAAPCACSCAPCGACRPTSTGGRRSGCATRPRRRPSRCRGACASACSWPGRPTARRRSTWRAPRSSWPPRPARRRRRSWCCARWPAARCRWSRACRSTRRLVREGELGLLFEPRDAVTLAAQLERLLAEPAAGRRLHGAHRARRTRSSSGRAWPSEFEALFDEIAARRHGNGRPDVRSAGSPSATSSTSTCTCTPTTRPTARRRCATLLETAVARRARRDRGDRPQRDLGRARGARAGGRDQGDRGRGGQDRRPGRGDRPLHRGEDPARHDAAGDDRRDPPPGRARLRPASVRPHALRARLRAPARRRRGHRRDGGLQPARRLRGVQRGGGPLRGQVPDRGRRRIGLATWPRGSDR